MGLSELVRAKDTQVSRMHESIAVGSLKILSKMDPLEERKNGSAQGLKKAGVIRHQLEKMFTPT